MNSVVYMSFNGHPPIQFLLKQAIKDRALRGLSRGMCRFSGSEAVDVEDNLINLDDVVF